MLRISWNYSFKLLEKFFSIFLLLFHDHFVFVANCRNEDVSRHCFWIHKNRLRDLEFNTNLRGASEQCCYNRTRCILILVYQGVLICKSSLYLLLGTYLRLKDLFREIIILKYSRTSLIRTNREVQEFCPD